MWGLSIQIGWWTGKSDYYENGHVFYSSLAGSRDICNITELLTLLVEVKHWLRLFHCDGSVSATLHHVDWSDCLKNGYDIYGQNNFKSSVIDKNDIWFHGSEEYLALS